MTITADAPVATGPARSTTSRPDRPLAPTFPAYEHLTDPAERVLAAVVRRIAGDPSRWGHLVRQGPQRSGTRIEVTEGVEVWVIAWPTFQATELHSHGEATTAYTTVAGAITEIRPDRRGRLLPRTFVPGVVQVVRPGEVHDVRNERATPAVTIHAYSPRLSSMTFYGWSAGRLSVDRVAGPDDLGAGAW